MKPKSNKLQIPSFDDTTVVGINSSLPDYKLALTVNNALAIDLARHDDLLFEGIPYAFFYYTAGENYNVYNLVGLTSRERVLYPFKPRLDYLFLIQNTLSPERQMAIMRSLRRAQGIVHAFVLEKDKNLRIVLETIAGCEQQMIDKQKKNNVRDEVRKRILEQQALFEALRVAQ